jgi:hypothetical protein
MNWLARILGALALIAACGLGYLAWTAWTSHERGVSTAAQSAATGKSIASATASGYEAVQSVQREAESEVATVALTRSNREKITHAKGAEVPVTPDADNAGLRALCLRHAYHLDPTCRQIRQPGS